VKIFILNGPNLNKTGKRDPLLYGTETFEKIMEGLRAQFPELELEYRQSNSEGEMINWLQDAEQQGIHGIIINPGAYSHYSLALADALLDLSIPRIEVHLSNIHSREDFRRQSVTASACHGVIAGLGKDSYRLALEWMRQNGARKTGFQIDK
jgi:3-dehydroquinate dehydratase-2